MTCWCYTYQNGRGPKVALVRCSMMMNLVALRWDFRVLAEPVGVLSCRTCRRLALPNLSASLLAEPVGVLSLVAVVLYCARDNSTRCPEGLCWASVKASALWLSLRMTN